MRKLLAKNEKVLLNQIRKRNRIMAQYKTRNLDFRRARTRTLIQLGGLIEKSGLTDVLDIELGQDLQQDEECFEANATLLGALLDLKKSWNDENIEQQKVLWAQRGKEMLASG